jgi:hypothetical protein
MVVARGSGLTVGRARVEVQYQALKQALELDLELLVLVTMAGPDMVVDPAQDQVLLTWMKGIQAMVMVDLLLVGVVAAVVVDAELEALMDPGVTGLAMALTMVILTILLV